MKQLKFIFLLLLLPFLFGCGPRRIGYGVMLWQEPDSDLQPNDMLVIYIDSNIRDTYTYGLRKFGEMYESPRWRIQFFQKKKQALLFSQQYNEYMNIFARTLNNGLLVREKPDASSERVYRLRIGEEVKILEREAELSDVGKYQGYWYRVLTQEGVQGFCFDHYLKVFDDTLVDRNQEEDGMSQNLVAFFNNTYAPDYYRNMIDKRAIDLDRFRSQYGLFPDLDNMKITIVLEDFENEFVFTGISATAQNRYLFEGADLEIEFIRSTYISATLPLNGREESRDFVVVNDVDRIISDEKERRETELQNLTEKSSILQSDAYGRITVDENGFFEWNGFDRLVPHIIPGSYSRKGKIVSNHFISSELASRYDGVISFLFADAPRNSYVHFLYSIKEDGIQFTTLSGISPRNKIFERQSEDPVIIFFSYMFSDGD